MATDTEAPEAPTAEATKTTKQVFRYSTYVHVGDGAEDCPHAEDGACDDGQHFHAYVRLPNQFQHTDIREKALAAKARRIRQLRDPESDARAILDADLDALRRDADVDALIDELLQKNWWKRHLEATEDVRERDEFEHIGQDQERLVEIERMEPDARPADEYEELVTHLGKFGQAIEERRNEIENPLRDTLKAKDVDELVGLIAEDRIEAEASRAFMETYSKWQVFVGTLAPDERRPHLRVFNEIGDVESADTQVVEALRLAFTTLETGLQRPPS